MACLVLASWLGLFRPSRATHLHYFAIAALLIYNVIALTCVYNYAQGRNWARVAVLLTSILSIVGLIRLRHEDTLGKIISVAFGVLSFFFLYWLNTRTVRE